MLCYRADAQLVGLARQAVDDSLRCLRPGEHTVVGLRHQWHPMPFEPFVRIAVVELPEQPFHEAVTARIHLFQVGNAGKAVRQVASSAARNAHFCQHAARLFKNNHFGVAVGLPGCYGSKETRCAAAYDGNMAGGVHENIVLMSLRRY